MHSDHTPFLIPVHDLDCETVDHPTEPVNRVTLIFFMTYDAAHIAETGVSGIDLANFPFTHN